MAVVKRSNRFKRIDPLKNRFLPSFSDVYVAIRNRHKIKKGQKYHAAGICEVTRRNGTSLGVEKWPLIYFGEGVIGPADPNDLMPLFEAN